MNRGAGCVERAPADAPPYAGRRIALATMHEKDRAVAPALQSVLGALVVVPPGLNTDSLGTFSGEVARPGSMRETALQKARMGMEACGLGVGLASEGSYGPHPYMPFVPGGVELMVLVDDELGLTLFETLIDDAPCFDHVEASPGGDLDGFLARIDFPRQAVIVGPKEPVSRLGAEITKGIRDRAALRDAIAAAADASLDRRARVETDMRAHMNPTRMATLERLAERLAGRMARTCPACAAPGFGLVDIQRGLPCAWCATPTTMQRGEIEGCSRCDLRQTLPRADGLTEADPGHCPRCNP
jgi:hypothetical protein